MTQMYAQSRMGRNPVGTAATGQIGLSATASLGAGGGGTAPTAIAILTGIGFLVVFYWATKQVQGSR